MRKSTMANIAKTVAVGMAVGGAVAAVGNQMKRPNNMRKMKRATNKAMKNVGNLIDNASHMMNHYM